MRLILKTAGYAKLLTLHIHQPLMKGKDRIDMHSSVKIRNNSHNFGSNISQLFEGKQKSQKEKKDDRGQKDVLSYLTKIMETNISKQKQSVNISKQKQLANIFRGQKQEQNDNPLQFMKVISHILSKESSHHIIKMIQDYCHVIKQSKERVKRQEQFEELNKNLKQYLQNELILTPQNREQNGDFINKLLDFFRGTNPHQVTLQMFEKYNYSEHSEPQNSTIKKNQLTNLEFKVANQQCFEMGYGDHQQRMKSKTDGKPLRQIQVKQAPQNFVFTQLTQEHNLTKYEESLKYAYVYDLPYNMNNKDCQQLIAHIEKIKKVKIVSYKLFPYRDFIENERRDVIFNLPESYKDKVRIQKIYRSVTIDHILDGKHKQKITKKTGKVEQEKIQTPYSSLKLVTQSLLKKINLENYSKFNRSSLVLQFASIKNKQVVMVPSFRLFGLNYGQLKNIKFQQGHCKTSIILTGLLSGYTSTELALAVNKVLSPSNIQIAVPDNCYLAKNYIKMQFSYFTDALQALKLLNNLSIQGKKLKAMICYGPMKVFNGQYKEEQDDSYDLLKKRILEISRSRQ